MKMSKKSKVIIYALLTLVAVYFLAPFVYMLFTTFKTEAEAIAYPPKLFRNGFLETLKRRGRHSLSELIY